MSLENLIQRTAELFFLIPLATAISRRKNLSTSFYYVYQFLIAVIILYVFRRIGTLAFHNNNFSYHLFTVLEVFFLFNAYYHFFPSRTLRTSVRVAQFLFIPIAIADAVVQSGITNRINTFSNTYAGTILVAFAIIHLYKIVENPVQGLRKNPFFIFSTAILFNYTISTAIHTAGYFTANNSILFNKMVAAFPLLNAFYNGLLAYAFSLFPLSVEPRNALPQWLRFTTRRKPTSVSPAASAL